MRHLQTYRLFESAQSLTQDQKDFLTRHTSGTWSLNPSTGLVDVEGNFNCSGLNLENFKGIQFGAVSGDFYCDSNSLTSLEGAPQTVGGSFDCDSNSLTSLEGAPETVGGSFHCDSNRLTSLEGAPETVGGGFYSDDLEIPKGKWGLETFIHLLTTGKPEEQKLVSSLVDPEVLQQKIDENPEKMLVKLKGGLKHPHFQSLRWPERLDQEKDLLSDLDDIGL
jgi:hypothetical protein